MQIPATEHWTEVEDFYGRVGERIEGPELDRNTTGRITESTNLDPWEVSETKPTKDQPRTYIGWTKDLGTYVVDVLLNFHVSPPTTGASCSLFLKL